jgi:hypothetical protein
MKNVGYLRLWVIREFCFIFAFLRVVAVFGWTISTLSTRPAKKYRSTRDPQRATPTAPSQSRAVGGRAGALIDLNGTLVRLIQNQPLDR